MRHACFVQILKELIGVKLYQCLFVVCLLTRLTDRSLDEPEITAIRPGLFANFLAKALWLVLC